jgi:phage terminase large subunit-like protein
LIEPWNLSCPDWETCIRDGLPLVPKLPLNRADAKRAIGIFNKLRLGDVEGHPTLAEAAGDWFRDIVGALFGSVDPETRRRMVRELFALVPKKNAKTSYGAGLMMTALLLNKRPRAEFLFIGPTQAVSDIAFDMAVGMIENDPAEFLQKRMHIQAHLKTITDRKTKAELKIKTFDASVLTGVKPVGTLVDELHEIAKNPRAGKIIGQLRGGMIANPEGFLVFISTQSDQAPSGVFKAELQKARAIRDGEREGAMLPVLYEFPLDMVKDKAIPPAGQMPENWHMVLPNLNRSITLDRLEEDFDAAKETGEEELRRWASQHLNIEIGVGLHSDRWAGAEYWEACAVKGGLTLEEIKERSEICVVGIDGGGLDDLLGLAVMGREKITRDWLLWSHAWAHPAVFERRKDVAATLRDFEKDGDLTVVEKVGDDVRDVVLIVKQLDDAGLLPPGVAVGVDQAGISEIVDGLGQAGIVRERIGGVPQGWKLTGAIKTTERRLAGGTLKHGGCGLMAFAVGNAKVEPRGNAITIDKAVAGSAKIDPLMALFDAVVTMSSIQEDEPSVYLSRGLLFV